MMKGYYTVALFVLATGKYSGCIGRFGDGHSATEHARRHVAALNGAAISTVTEGGASVKVPGEHPIDCSAYAAPVRATHHLDDLVAVVIPPVSDPIHLGVASFFLRRESAAA